MSRAYYSAFERGVRDISVPVLMPVAAALNIARRLSKQRTATEMPASELALNALAALRKRRPVGSTRDAALGRMAYCATGRLAAPRTQLQPGPSC
ncbi:MAG: helix-turn-helix transcriptional regulator [Armatimonadetes bacterium]|nr:helix-turn-helix transcriptional regulator [Armatimonadota bacterium]MDE2205833.1 helix-turn-helix transcriptional regulator [Armatimonadota bacterium]